MQVDHQIDSALVATGRATGNYCILGNTVTTLIASMTVRSMLVLKKESYGTLRCTVKAGFWLLPAIVMH